MTDDKQGGSQDASETRARSRGKDDTRDPLQTVVSAVRDVGLFLLPSFAMVSVGALAMKRPLRKTAFLDGLRGVIALLVAFLHQMGRTNYSYGRPYYLGPYKDSEDPQDYTSPAQLPIIRVFCAGGTGVAVFFVISGYVLSLRPVQLMRRAEAATSIAKRQSLQGALVDTLFSTSFRRGFRLFLPCIAGIFLFECMDAVGLYHVKHSAPGAWGYLVHFHYFLDTMAKAVWNVDGEMINTLRHLWTVPVEFSCSLALVVVVMGTSGLSAKGRTRCLLALMFFAFYYNHGAFFAYLSGMFLAESEEARADLTNDTKSEEDKSSWGKGVLAPLYTTLWVLLLLVSLYLFGWPALSFEKDPVLRRVNWVLGRNRALALASFAFVSCLFRLPWLQRIFTQPFAIYLGNISYSVYCVHYPFIMAFENVISGHVGGIFGAGRVGHLNRFLANSYEAFLMQCIILWAADLFWRLVDIPVVKFTSWLERKCKNAVP